MVKQYFYTEVICKYCTYVGTNESTIRIANIMLKETLNKSHHKIVCTSCLHISRQPAQKILVMRQHYCGLCVQPDEKSDGAICTNDLISVSLNFPPLIEHFSSEVL